MQKTVIQLETLTCPSCMQKIENLMKNLDGVDSKSVKVLFNASKVKAEFNVNLISIERIQKAIENLGYEVLKTKIQAA
ncbi:metal-binding protein [Dellaglioa algida]|uniref:heavy-metal-associated domain-containing protein n=1 Tax=Dellaglioa carnosa TaxID=2995136 RepID=UPI0011B55F4F|nr:heavy metal-associated domain-containing protein [Dellaglioa carnosa]MCZ2492804.1 cation transporter [Dellaglioa carnosa]TWW13298.1 metal-binding protein [Dellaglioa algida]